MVIFLSGINYTFFFGCFSSRYAYNAHGFMLYCMQMRRYGQIDLSPRCRNHQVLVGATRWRFKSSCPHHQKALKTLSFQGFWLFIFRCHTAVGGGVFMLSQSKTVCILGFSKASKHINICSRVHFSTARFAGSSFLPKKEIAVVSMFFRNVPPSYLHRTNAFRTP